MKLKILEEAGFKHALLGISLSYNQPFETEDAINKVYERAKKLAVLHGGHDKFLEHIMIWMDVTDTRYWWIEADTYRISTKQSESTIHTLMKQPLSQENFELSIPEEYLNYLNMLIKTRQFKRIKHDLPEGYLQRRIWLMSYKTLKNVLLQRHNHVLDNWHNFVTEIYKQIEHPEFLPQLDKK